MEKLTLKSMKLYFEGIPELETERLILTLFSRNDMVPYLRYNEDGTSLLSRVIRRCSHDCHFATFIKIKG